MAEVVCPDCGKKVKHLTQHQKVAHTQAIPSPHESHPCHNCASLRWAFITISYGYTIHCPYCDFDMSLAIAKCPHYRE